MRYPCAALLGLACLALGLVSGCRAHPAAQGAPAGAPAAPPGAQPAAPAAGSDQAALRAPAAARAPEEQSHGAIPRFTLGALDLAASDSQVVTALGHPQSIHRTEGGTLYKYDGMTVAFNAAGAAWRLDTTDSRYATAEGLRVGQDGAVVRRLYGRPLVENPAWWLYGPALDGSSLRVSFREGQVSGLAVEQAGQKRTPAPVRPPAYNAMGGLTRLTAY